MILPPVFHDGPIGYLLRHLVAGLTGGAVFGGLILVFDLGGLRGLIGASQDGWIYVILLFVGLFVTFGSAALGFGVMSLGEEKER